MGFFSNIWDGFSRIFSLIGGIFVEKVSEVEAGNPSVAYQNMIDESKVKYQQWQKDVSGIVYHQSLLEDDLKKKEKERTELQGLLDQAIADNDAELGPSLMEDLEATDKEVASLKEQLTEVTAKVNDYQQKLRDYEAHIKRLEKEKRTVTAQAATDKAVIEMSGRLKGMSIESGDRTLEALRESMGKLHAQAKTADSMGSESREEKMRKLRERANTTSASSKFAERVQAMKAQTPESKAKGKIESKELG